MHVACHITPYTTSMLKELAFTALEMPGLGPTHQCYYESRSYNYMYNRVILGYSARKSIKHRHLRDNSSENRHFEK